MLAELREGLRPLVAAIAERAGRGRRLLPARALPGRRAAAAGAASSLADLPLDPGAWRLDTTVHPFATAIATTDVRLTTRYDEAYVGAALWSALHEAGHGLYENGIDPALRRTPLCRAAVARVPRVPEPHVGELGRAQPAVPALASIPGCARRSRDRSTAVDPEQLYRAANRVRRR